jgi:hypothetical protein
MGVLGHALLAFPQPSQVLESDFVAAPEICRGGGQQTNETMGGGVGPTGSDKGRIGKDGTKITKIKFGLADLRPHKTAGLEDASFPTGGEAKHTRPVHMYDWCLFLLQTQVSSDGRRGVPWTGKG